MTAHALYVSAAYGASAIVIASLVLWVVLDNLGRRRDMAELDAAGVRRRSERKAGSAD